MRPAGGRQAVTLTGPQREMGPPCPSCTSSSQEPASGSFHGQALGPALGGVELGQHSSLGPQHVQFRGRRTCSQQILNSVGRGSSPCQLWGGAECPPLLAEGRLRLRSRCPSDHRFPSGRCPDSRPQSAHPQPHRVSQAPSPSPTFHHLCFSYGCAFCPSRQDCRPGPSPSPHPLPCPFSAESLGPTDSTRVDPWTLDSVPSPLFSLAVLPFRNSGWVGQWLRAHFLGQSLASVPYLPLTGWHPGADFLTSRLQPPDFAGGWQRKKRDPVWQAVSTAQAQVQPLAACWEEVGTLQELFPHALLPTSSSRPSSLPWATRALSKRSPLYHSPAQWVFTAFRIKSGFSA